MTTDPQAEKSDLVSRKEALAALKHKDLVVHQDDDGDDHRFDFVYLDSALEALAALPAIPLDHEPPTDAQVLYVAQVFHAAYEQEAKANAWDSQTPVPWDDLPEANVRTMLATVRRVWSMLPAGALPVLETKKEES